MDENTEQKLLFESVITMGQSALKYSFIANSGAVVLIFGLISKAIGGYSGTELASPILAFSLGVLTALVATGLAYTAQCIFGIESIYKIKQIFKIDTFKLGDIAHVATAVFVVLSYILFAIGCYLTYFALK